MKGEGLEIYAKKQIYTRNFYSTASLDHVMSKCISFGNGVQSCKCTVSIIVVFFFADDLRSGVKNTYDTSFES